MEEIREIGHNVPHSMEEKEEDLLEFLYTNWKSGIAVYPREVCGFLSVSPEELKELELHLERAGFLRRRAAEGCFHMTEQGKIRGEECLYRHHNLTQFLQMTCGLPMELAEENACRMEHVIGDEVVCGIREFLKYGDTYDRVVKNYDLHERYDTGSYRFCMSLYCIERRNPRALARETSCFSDRVTLKITPGKCHFYLEAKEAFCKMLWYLDKKQWFMAKKEGETYRIPADAFAYVISPYARITECDCVVGFTEREKPPAEEECRELNIHIW